MTLPGTGRCNGNIAKTSDHCEDCEIGWGGRNPLGGVGGKCDQHVCGDETEAHPNPVSKVLAPESGVYYFLNIFDATQPVVWSSMLNPVVLCCDATL
jgi:hypothetical protein